MAILDISENAALRLKRARLLVFDLDGTLIDSRQDLASAVNATLQDMGKPEISTDAIASYVGDGAAALIERALQSAGLDTRDPELLNEAYRHFLRFYREHKLDHTYVYPGVIDALASLRRRLPQVMMACLTNKPVAPSRAICEALTLAPFFFQIYGGNSFTTKKPDPLGLNKLITEAAALAMQSQLSAVDPRNTVVIGDGIPDVLLARAAGTHIIGCDFGFSPVNLASLCPDAIVTAPHDWVDLLCDS